MSSPEMNNSVGSTGESRQASAAGAVAQKISSTDISERIEVLRCRFDTLKPIGAHGNAAFYLGRDLRAKGAHGLVRLKVFSGHDARLLKLFMLEALSAAQLSHKNIIKTGPPEEIEGVYFSVIERGVGGETLKDLVDLKGWLELRQAIRVAHQMADALNYSHKLGVLHLRIRPESVVLDSDGTALLADFGLGAGSELSWAHRERSRHCAAHFVSPEQVCGMPVDVRSDLYSFGVLMYKMLTDRVPFDSEDADTIRQKHLSRSPVPPHLLCANVPLWLSGLVTCLLEKDPARRFQSADAFRSELERLSGARLGVVRQSYDTPKRTAEAIRERSCSPLVTDPPEQVSNGGDEGPLSVSANEAPVNQTSCVGRPLPDGGVFKSPQLQIEEHKPVEPITVRHSVEMVKTEGLRKARWLRWTLTIGLAIAVAGGLIAPARSSRAPSADQGETPLEVPVIEKGIGDNSTINQQPASNPQLQTESAASTDTAVQRYTAGSAIHKPEKRFVRPSTSRRVGYTKRKPPRYKRYWRAY